MKKFLLLFTASNIVGLFCLLTCYYLFSMKKATAITIGMIAVVTGLITEYLRPFFVTLKQRQKEEISRRVRRNLKKKI